MKRHSPMTPCARCRNTNSWHFMGTMADGLEYSMCLHCTKKYKGDEWVLWVMVCHIERERNVKKALVR